MQKFKLFSYLLITGMLFSNANMYAMDEQSQNLGSNNVSTIANIRYDCSFKKVFTEESNKDILANLLNNIYGFNISDEDGMRIRRILITPDTTIPDTKDGVKTCFDVHCTCVVAKDNNTADKVLAAISAVNKSEKPKYAGQNFEQNAYFLEIEMQNRLQHSFTDRLLAYENKLQDQGFNQIHSVCNHQKQDEKFLYDLPRVRVLAFISFFLRDGNNEIINEDKVFLHTAPCFVEEGTLQDGNLVLGENNISKVASNKQLITYIQLPAIDTEKVCDSELGLWLKLLGQSRGTAGSCIIDRSVYQNSNSIMKAIRVLSDFYRGNSQLLKDCAAEEERSLAETDAREAQIRQEGLEQGRREGLEQGRQEGAMIERKKNIVYKLAKRRTAEEFAAKRQTLLEDGRYNAVGIQSFIREQNFNYYQKNNFDGEQIAKKLKLSSQEQQGSGSLPTSTK